MTKSMKAAVFAGPGRENSPVRKDKDCLFRLNAAQVDNQAIYHGIHLSAFIRIV